MPTLQPPTHPQILKQTLFIRLFIKSNIYLTQNVCPIIRRIWMMELPNTKAWSLPLLEVHKCTIFLLPMKDTYHSWFAVFTQDSIVAKIFCSLLQISWFSSSNMDLNLKSFGKVSASINENNLHLKRKITTFTDFFFLMYFS